MARSGSSRQRRQWGVIEGEAGQRPVVAAVPDVMDPVQPKR
jgi:hypothetical protein